MPPHPHSHCRHAGTMVGGEGWQMLYSSTRLRLYREASHCKTKVFLYSCTLASYISHNLKTVWSGDTCVSAPLVSPHRPRAWRSPDCSRRGGLSLPDTDMPPPTHPTAPSAQTRQFTYLIGGAMVEVESGREHPEPKKTPKQSNWTFNRQFPILGL